MTGYDDLQRKLTALRDGTATKAVLLEVGNTVVRQAQINLRPHDKTGNLARSIMVRNVSAANQSAEVRAGGTQGIGYARFLEFGTGIYPPGGRGRPIVPVRAKALRFPAAGAGVRLSGNLTKAQQRAGGGWQFRKSVRGIRPVFYMTNAVKDTVRALQVAPVITDVWNKA